jgi:VCBS repeat-containing protein
LIKNRIFTLFVTIMLLSIVLAGPLQNLTTATAAGGPRTDAGVLVNFTLSDPLDHIVVTPPSANIVFGASQQFSAQGYDASGNTIPDVPITWIVANGGGSITSTGLFTADTTTGTFTDTVIAASGSVQGKATVIVSTPVLHHFEFLPIIFTVSNDADTTPPEITTLSPIKDENSVDVNTNVSVFFNEGLDPFTISTATFELRDSLQTIVPSTITYSTIDNKAILDPLAALNYSTSYSITIKGGAIGVRDLAGNPLSGDVVWSFLTSTNAPLLPEEGPGGPILVISAAANPFSRYYAEILRAEGLNAFQVMDVSSITSATLVGYDVAILGEMALSDAQVTLLTDWVNAGGNLIAMRPDPKLAALLGLTGPSSSLSNAYLLVNTAQAPGSGIVGETIQYHGPADLYTVNGATSIATLYSNASSPTTNPAVTLRSTGSNGGQAAAFTYDLARSVVYTRQGNPAWAGQERDGDPPIRSDDLFFGGAQADWIDLNKVAIPQADEQQRLLANLIGYMEMDRMPIPRFWYLPRNEKAAVLMTGDDHNSNYSDDRFDQFNAFSPTGCSVDDWSCIRASAYIYTDNALTNQQAASYTSQGFEVGLHVNTNCADFTLASLTSFYSNQLAQFGGKFASIPAPNSERTHCIAWSDWASQLKVKIQNNIRLDTNYYFWPSDWVQNRSGFFTGSGIPMRFADLDGTMFDVYQAVTQMTDESGQTYPYTIDTLLDRALGSQGYYGVFTANMHNDVYDHSGADAIVNSALSRSVPVISGRQLLTWLDGRNSSSFKNLSWSGNSLIFSVESGAGANGLTVLVPVQSKVGPLTGLTLNGIPVTYVLETIKGVQYISFQASSGTYQAIYNLDSIPPVISTVNPLPGSNGIVSITWATDELADSLVIYGTNSADLNQSLIDYSLVSSHSMVLNGLQPGTTYYYRVISADSAGNSSTWPVVSNPPSSFLTQVASLGDQTTANFSAGTGGTGIYIAGRTDGEVLLRPTLVEEFATTGLPSGWSSTTWTTGGKSSVSGGLLIVDGALASTTTYYAAGRAIEFYGTFGGEAYQHMGLGQSFNSSESWAMFSTHGTANTLYARTSNSGSAVNTPIPGNWIGAPHRFRIEWTASSVVFYIDGNLVHTEIVSISATMRPVFSDYTYGGKSLQVDWLQMSPYTSSGIFTSRVFDAGQKVYWNNFSWTADKPTGTGLTFTVRTGDTPLPDASWSTFTTIPNSGDPVNRAARYIQYQAALSATNLNQTPVVKDVTIYYASVGNLSPVASTDSYSTAEDTVLVIAAPGILVNDTDADGNPLTAVKVTNPAHGTVTLNANGSFTYTPAANYAGSDSFTYKANDGMADSNVATVTFTVTPVNDAPAAAADAYTTAEDTALTIAAPGVLGNDTDADGSPFTAVKVTNPAHGTLTLNANGSFTYTPAANYTGSDSFTYKANDGTVDSNIVTVTFTVTPVNDAPVITGQQALTVNEDATLAIKLTDLSVTDVDNTYPTSFSLTVQSGANYTVAGTVVTPAANYNGTLTVPVKVNDGQADSNVYNLTLTVTPANDAPAAAADAYTTAKDTALTIAAPGVLGNDTDADSNPLTAVKVTNPAYGTLTLNANGSFTYTPAANYAGSDSFTYKANDGTVDSNIVTVTITVTAGNSAPAAAADAYSTAEDTALTIAAPGVLGNDTDVDGNPLTAVKVTNPGHGTLTLNANGSFAYTPAANYAGSDSFTYKANDGTVDSNIVTVTFTVTPVNDAPAAAADAYSTAEDTALIITAPGVLSNDTDVDGNPLTAVKVTNPAHGTLTLNANGSFAYTPAANYAGSDSFTYKANDGIVDSNIVTVTFTVTPVNDAPAAMADTYSASSDTPLNIAAPGVLMNDTDIDGNPLTAVKVSDPAHGTLVLNANGSFTYTPAANYSGLDNFTYLASDGQASSNVATVTITVLSGSIFADGFENGSLNAWSANVGNSGDLTVNGTSALVGSFGLQVRINDNTPTYIVDNKPTAETSYRMRFYFDPNSIAMAKGNDHAIFNAYDGAGNVVARVDFGYNRNYQVYAGLVRDAGTWVNSSWMSLSDAPHYIEIEWRASTAAGANNGILTLWVDGVQRASQTGIDNDTKRIESVRLGAVESIDSRTRGTYFFDQFDSRRSGYIGP